jgi:hypothetical protein
MAGRRMARLRDVFGSRTGAILAVVVLCSLLLSGCGDIGDILADLFNINGNGNGNGNGNANAQEGDQQIETFQVTSFQLDEVSPVPEITVSDGATRYDLQSAGVLRLTLPDGTRTFNLDTGDIVIERPQEGLVTVVTDADEF